MKIRNPKSEIRNKLEVQNSKRFSFSFLSAFGISFSFRISCFGLRICFASFLLHTLELHAVSVSNGWKRLPDLPDPIGVAGAFAGVSGGALIVAGGANFPDAPPWEGGKKVWYDTIWALEKPDGEWLKVGKLPKPNGYGVSISIPRGLNCFDWPPKQSTGPWSLGPLPEGLLCIGGGSAETNYSDVFSIHYTNRSVTIETWPSLPKPRANAFGIRADYVVVIAGGLDSPTATTALDSVYSLFLSNPKTGWGSYPPPDKCQPRQLAMAGAIGKTVYLVGGTSLAPDENGKPVRTYLKDAFRMPTGGPFASESDMPRIADLPFPLAASPSPAATVNGKLIIFGGDDAPSADAKTHKGFRDEMLEYDPATDTWSVIGRMPAPRATAPVVFWNGGYVVVSGEVRRGVRSREVWMWTP